MQQSIIQLLVLLSARLPVIKAACTIPPGPPSNNISTGFAIQVQNASYPVIHNRMMNLVLPPSSKQYLVLIHPTGRSRRRRQTSIPQPRRNLRFRSNTRQRHHHPKPNTYPRGDQWPSKHPHPASFILNRIKSTHPRTTPPKCS